MAMTTCAECGKDYSDQAKACVHCGARNPHRAPVGGIVGKVVLGLVVAFVALMALGLLIKATNPDISARVDAKHAISYCDDNYAKLKGDPRMTQGALEIAYGACEKLRDDYRQRWGEEP